MSVKSSITHNNKYQSFPAHNYIDFIFYVAVFFIFKGYILKLYEKLRGRCQPLLELQACIEYLFPIYNSSSLEPLEAQRDRENIVTTKFVSAT
jgi:hypothetical protein